MNFYITEGKKNKRMSHPMGETPLCISIILVNVQSCWSPSGKGNTGAFILQPSWWVRRQKSKWPGRVLRSPLKWRGQVGARELYWPETVSWFETLPLLWGWEISHSGLRFRFNSGWNIPNMVFPMSIGDRGWLFLENNLHTQHWLSSCY